MKERHIKGKLATAPITVHAKRRIRTLVEQFSAMVRRRRVLSWTRKNMHRKMPISFQDPMKSLQNSSRVVIVHPPMLVYAAHLFVLYLQRWGVQSIRSDSFYPVRETDSVVVLAPLSFEALPKSYFIYQVESLEVSPVLSPEYLEVLAQSQGILDSSKRNIQLLRSLGFDNEAMSQLTLSHAQNIEVPLNSRNANVPGIDQRDIDVLFYGAVNERRRVALEHISSRFTVLVVSDTYGQEMDKLIRRAKVVINIHFYEGALLETLRISQCFTQGTPVVSEKSIDDCEYNMVSNITLIEPGNWRLMASAIEKYLGDVSYWHHQHEQIVCSR